MAVREGYRDVSVYLINPEAKAIRAFAEQVFGAETVGEPLIDETGTLRHCALRIGDSVILVGAAPEGTHTERAFLHVYVEDCAATHAKAVAEGAESVMPPAPQPHGDMAGMVRDMGGNTWWIAEYQETVPNDVLLERKGLKGA
ncbi:MAG: VOC family protein [Pseudomonadota bacterium]